MIDNARNIFEEYIREYASLHEMPQKEVNALLTIYDSGIENHTFELTNNNIQVRFLQLITFNGQSVLCWLHTPKTTHRISKIQSKSEVEQLIKDGEIDCFMAIKKEYFLQ